MKSRRFVQCDVFSPIPLQGNGLAVVIDGEGLSADQMQQYATWTNLAETTFLLPPTDPSADYRVRIFTVAQELPFAGHPTLGSCAAWLHTGGVPKTPGVVRQQSALGIVDVDISKAPEFAFAAPPTSVKPMKAETRAGIVQIMGIHQDAVVNTVELTNGPTWQLFELRHASDVIALDATRLAYPQYQFVGFIAPHDPGSECQYEVRMFGFSSTMTEDPITGSLNAAIAQWLKSTNRLTQAYQAAQGTCMGRHGRVAVRLADDGVVWIGGQVHVLIDGHVSL